MFVFTGCANSICWDIGGVDRGSACPDCNSRWAALPVITPTVLKELLFSILRTQSSLQLRSRNRYLILDFVGNFCVFWNGQLFIKVIFYVAVFLYFWFARYLSWTSTGRKVESLSSILNYWLPLDQDRLIL